MGDLVPRAGVNQVGIATTVTNPILIAVLPTIDGILIERSKAAARRRAERVGVPLLAGRVR